jgi:hypothetical protein
MSHLHETASKHKEQAQLIKIWRDSGKLKSKRVSLTDWESNLENLLYGVLDGMSFQSNANCYSGLVNAIYYGFEALDNDNIYDPSQTIKFVIAGS